MKLLLTCAPGLEPGKTAHLLVLDWESREIIDVTEIRHEIYETSHKGFAGGAVVGDKLIVTTEVELLEFQLKPLKLLRRTSHPLLNDAHHVCAHQGKYYVANAGMDSVEIFDQDFNHVESVLLYPKYGFDWRHIKRLIRDDLRRWRQRKQGGYRFYDHLNSRFPFKNVFKFFTPAFFHKRKKDVRFTDFRPHMLHPNHCESVGDDVWVTLWRTGAVMSMKTGRIIVRGLGRPHDGEIIGQQLMATDCTTNRLFSFDLSQPGPGATAGNRREKTITDSLEAGFLRGCTASEDHVYVGLTARRKTEKWKFARVVQLDRKTLSVQDDWSMPEEYGKQIYSVIDVSAVYE